MVDPDPRKIEGAVHGRSAGGTIRSASPAVVHVDYTGGAAVGTAALVSWTGLRFTIPPDVMFTGRQVWDAVVTGQSPEGIPEYTPGDDPIFRWSIVRAAAGNQSAS